MAKIEGHFRDLGEIPAAAISAAIDKLEASEHLWTRGSPPPTRVLVTWS